MNGMLSPSLMCADALNLQSEIEALDKLGVEYIHLDFMDNHFVPNITLERRSDQGGQECACEYEARYSHHGVSARAVL